MNKTKEAIFRAAIKTFSSKGYSGATMDDMAANAGVAKGTLYYYFKSKEEIFNYIISQGMELIKLELSSIVNLQKNPLDKLKKTCEIQLNLVYENRDFFKVVMSQLWGKEIRQLELRTIIESYILDIQKYISEAMETGCIKKADPSFVAYAFFGTICSSVIYELMNEEKRDIKQLIDTVVQYSLNGMKAVNAI